MARAREELVVETADAFEAALREVGVPHQRLSVESTADEAAQGADLVFEIGGTPVVVEAKSVVESSAAQLVAGHAGVSQTPVVVVADRIGESAREVLRSAGVGYFDRRGRLRLILPGVFVDVPVHIEARHRSPSAPLSSATSKEVALFLLEHLDDRLAVREIGRLLGRAPSSVSVALDGLRRSGLVTSANEPVIPELFWEMEAAWQRQPIALASVPQPFDARRTDPLQLGLGHGDDTGWTLDPVGWALTDTVAAVAYGAPLVAASGYPPDFYVPSGAVINRAIAALGTAPRIDERACTVSIAPVRSVCRRRTSLPSEVWPLASHVVVALDLAKDRARGREVLERWNPEGLARVW